MFAKPKFKASLDVHPITENYLFLGDEHQQVIVEGELYRKLAPFLDGRHSIAEIARKIGEKYSLPKVFFALDQLEKRGYTMEGEDNPDRLDAAFIEYLGGETSEVAGRFENLTLMVRSSGNNTASDSMADALRANGLTVKEPGDFLVVVTDDYLRPELESINREALEKNRPWMLVKPLGIELWIGPIFQPGKTGCWQCLAQRQSTNRQVERYIQDKGQRSDPVITSRCFLPATLELGYNLAAIEIAKWLIDPKATATLGKMVSLDLNSRKSREHFLVRRPQCPVCGDMQGRQINRPSSLRLVSRKKEFCEDGGHRTHTPEQTFQRYQHHVSPILGVVTELRATYGPKSQLAPSYVAGHNFAMGADNIVFLRQNLRGLSGGKGSSKIQAKASGLCEAIERYSGNYAGDEYSIRGTYTTLNPKAIHPNDCMGFSEQQFQRREEWNASHKNSRCVMIPYRFDADLELDWTPLWSLISQECRYLPTAYCYYGHPEFKDTRSLFADSNGSAAGNTLEEAILQGFMELAERDAVALWWYNRIKRPEVDLDSFKMVYVDAIREFYTSLNRELWVLDITSDLNIPTFACISRCTNRPVEDIILGFGAHFDPKIALLRAITEVNQFLPSILNTNPDGSTMYIFGDELAIAWWKTAVIEQQDYLLPDGNQHPTRFSDIHDPSSDDLLTDINTCIEIARKNSVELLVLDQTRPDIGLNVVKVVVPELCHFWRRLGKTRLYEIPVKQGWLDAPLPEDQLNPYSIFF